MSKPEQPPRELVSFIESLNEPHILCDRNYRILAANEAYRVKWVGQREVVGRTCYEVSHRYSVPCDQAGESCPLQRSLRSGQRERIVHLHHTHLGEQFENIELTPIRDDTGEIAYYIEKLDPLPVQRSEEHARGLLGRSPAFLAMMEMVARVAPSDAAVLLQGESGTGKEVTARALHQLSNRAQHPFVPVNCAAIAADLIESELFGHVKGAFTGASEARNGLFYYAHGGTLFLDEIGELPLAMQTKLLRALEERRIRPVGSSREVPVDVRIVAASNRNLAADVSAGRFRQDLYFRLAVVDITIPTLRSRTEDIPDLAQHFMALFSSQLGVDPLPLNADIVRRLAGYPWPGNVRELRNFIERSLILGEFPLQGMIAARPALAIDEEMTLAEVEKLHIQRVMSSAGGNKSEAARRLGISRKTLDRKFAEWGNSEAGGHDIASSIVR